MAVIIVIMIMMTVMVMSINRPVGGRSPRAGLKTTAQRRARRTHTAPLTSCHIGSRLSPLPLVLLFCFPLRWQPTATLLQTAIHRWQPLWLCLPPSCSHSHFPTFPSTRHPPRPPLSERFVFPLYIWALSFTCIPPLWICLTLSLSHLFCSPMG